MPNLDAFKRGKLVPVKSARKKGSIVLPFGEESDMLLEIEETKKIGDDLRRIQSIQGKTAKMTFAKTWITPAHKLFIDLVGNNKRQWFVTWATVESATDTTDESMTLEEIFFAAETRVSTPTQTANRICTLLRKGYDRDYLRAVVEKKLDAGITIASIKKAQGETRVFQPSLCRAWSKLSDSRKQALLDQGKYVATNKMDGLRCIIKLHTEDRGVYSRSLKPLYNMDHILEALESTIDVPCHIDGEALAENKRWNESMSGSKSKKGTDVAMQFYPVDLIFRDEVDAKRFEMPAEERHARMHEMIDYGAFSDLLVKVEETRVTEVAHVTAIHQQAMSEGWEGLVLHDLLAPYSCKRTNAWLKVKAWKSEDFAIKGFQPGTGKHLGRLGALVVEGPVECDELGASAVADELDGIQFITAEVGTGFSDREREKIWAERDNLLGTKVEVKYFQVTADASLRFPSFLRFRPEE